MTMKKYKVARRRATAVSPGSPVHQKHDKGYKRIFSKKQHFLHFLKKYIKADWANNIGEDDLTLIDKTFIDADFKQKESDVIYRVKIKGQEIIFYVLLELQSSVDYTMPFRLLKYIVALLKRIFNDAPKDKRETKGYRLPAVVPIVLYNGADNWTAIQSFKEYLQGYEQFGEYVIDFKYLLFDLKRETETTILSTEQLLDMAFALDKTKRNDMERILKIALETFRRMSDDDQEDLLNWIRYIWLNDIQDESSKDKIINDFKKGDLSNMTGGFSFIMQEERMIGEKIGENREKKRSERKMEKKVFEEKLEIAQKLIKRGLAIENIAEDTGLSVADIEKEVKKSNN